MKIKVGQVYKHKVMSEVSSTIRHIKKTKYGIKAFLVTPEKSYITENDLKQYYKLDVYETFKNMVKIERSKNVR